MKPSVRVGKKGRWSVALPESHLVSEHHVLDMAHGLKEIRGVKRAVVRGNHIYMRVRTDIKGLRRRIIRYTRLYCKGLFAPAVRRSSVRKGCKPPTYINKKRCRTKPRALTPISST